MKTFVPFLLFALLTFSCSNPNQCEDKSDELKSLRAEIDRLKRLKSKPSERQQEQIATFLTFQENNAEQAMNFYVGIFENSRIIDVQRHEAGGPAVEGSIFFATFELNGSRFACSDSYIKHEWDFTPGVSNFVTCKSEEELNNLFEKLSENGQVLMPVDNYGWSKKFAFVNDQFGVSWQLNLD